MGRKGHGVGFLGLSWHTLCGLPRKTKNRQQRVLLRIIGAIEGQNRCKTASHEAKKKCCSPAHKSIATMAKINNLGLELLPYPPYSPDLAPSNYYLFPSLNSKDGSSITFRKITFRTGSNRWNKCIDLKGDYIE